MVRGREDARERRAPPPGAAIVGHVTPRDEPTRSLALALAAGDRINHPSPLDSASTRASTTSVVIGDPVVATMRDTIRLVR